MTTQNPAPAATNPVSVGRVQDASPAASVVKERGDEPSNNVLSGSAQPLTRVSWAYEYRNYATHEWRRSAFHARMDGVPTTREEALNILRGRLPGWVPGTQLRLVEIVETANVAEPIGTFSPEREKPLPPATGQTATGGTQDGSSPPLNTKEEGR